MKEAVNKILDESIQDRIHIGAITGETLQLFHKSLISAISRYEKNTVLAEVIKVNTCNPPIAVISSPGGSIIYGFGFYDLIKFRGIDTLAIGEVSSMALIVFLAGKYRTCTKNTTFMQHQGGMLTIGKIYEVKQTVKTAEWLDNKCNTIILENTKITKTQLEKYRAIDWTFGAEEALEMGIVHEIIE